MPDDASAKQAAQLVLDAIEGQMRQLTQDLLDNRISLADWQMQMRDELRRGNALMVIAGAGGDKANVDPNDWLRLGNQLKSQYRYLEGFAHDLAGGNPNILSHALDRASMYARSTRASFYRQLAPVDLPAQPGDGSCEGLTRCKCDWEFEYTEHAILAYWRLGEAEHCDTCIARSVEWNPLTIPL